MTGVARVLIRDPESYVPIRLIEGQLNQGFVSGFAKVTDLLANKIEVGYWVAGSDMVHGTPVGKYIRLESDGRVSIEGYVYNEDGKTKFLKGAV